MAAGSAASTGSTSKTRPKTAFMASSDVAMPPLVLKKSRRFMPRRGAGRPASVRMRASTPALRGRLGQRGELLVGDETGGERYLGTHSAAQTGTEPKRAWRFSPSMTASPAR